MKKGEGKYTVSAKADRRFMGTPKNIPKELWAPQRDFCNIISSSMARILGIINRVRGFCRNFIASPFQGWDIASISVSKNRESRYVLVVSVRKPRLSQHLEIAPLDTAQRKFSVVFYQNLVGILSVLFW